MTGPRIAAALFAAVLAWWLVATTPSTPGDRHGETAPIASTPPRRVITGPLNGLAIQVNSADHALEKYSRLIGEIAQLGAGCVMLSVNGYQEQVESTQIAPRPSECPPDAVWLELFDAAHAAGLKVVFMPKILLTRPDGKWRGKIRPPSWDAWFAQYRKFILHFAELASRGRVEAFVVGSELVSSERYTDHWRRLIAETREVFSGLLFYSANWDHYSGIRFWEDLDAIGLTTYHKLSDGPAPTVEELANAWRPIQDKILAWRKTIDRPIIFTEVGWCSQEGCSIEPWNYFRKEEATPAGHEEQRRNYQAFVDIWSGSPDVAGMVWWEWTDAPGGSEDYGYTPRGKPAETLLRDLFLRRPAPQAARPAIEE
ncbi:MAG: hypothetical protein GY842_16700 [bacterium]|nr:hypothetical protein [bacterium]